MSSLAANSTPSHVKVEDRLRRLILLACFAFLAVAPAGCGRTRGAVPGANVLRYPLASDPTTWDPALANGDVPCELLQNIYVGLVTLDANSHVAPALAERWEASADGRVYTFHLRHGAQFHAPYARPVTAEDVRYSLTRALLPETRSPTALAYLGGIVGAEPLARGRTRELAGARVLDSGTIELRLTRPSGCFLSMLAYAPAWVVCREAIARSGGRLDEGAAIGAGPFRLAAYRRGVKVVLTANKEYFGGSPRLDRIERPIVPDRHMAHLMYERGEVDLCDVTASDYRHDASNPELRGQLRLEPLAAVSFLVMHPKRVRAFRDVRVRRALAAAIDRDAIVRIAMGGAAARADGLVPPELLPGASGGLPAFDPAAARRALAEAGYPGGRGCPRLTLAYMSGSAEGSAAAQLIRDDLRRNLGVEIDLQQREPASFVADYYAEKVPFYLAGWSADYPDPRDFLSSLLSSRAPLNHYGYASPAFDSLCDRADAERDAARRVPQYHEAERLAMQDVALLPISFGERRLLVKPYVQNLQLNLVNLLPHRRTRVAR